MRLAKKRTQSDREALFQHWGPVLGQYCILIWTPSALSRNLIARDYLDNQSESYKLCIEAVGVSLRFAASTPPL